MSILVLLFMIGMHILEDFHLQGIMAQMKQKEWWDDKKSTFLGFEGDEAVFAETDMYRFDYIAVLLLHGFEWAMFVNIPVMVSVAVCNGLGVLESYSVLFVIEIALMDLAHALIDHAKANKYSINLIEDQALHMVQIIAIYAMWAVIL